MILIGSRALKWAGEKFLAPQSPRSWDTDVICSYAEYEQAKTKLTVKAELPINKGKSIAIRAVEGNFEFEIAWSNSSSDDLLALLDKDIAFKQEYDTGLFKTDWIASPDLIFALKKSHRFLKNSPHFLKTMLDYRHLRDECDCKIPKRLQEWYKKREKETYWYVHPKLNQSKDAFFSDDGIPYIYDHDTIHLAVAHLDQPAYEHFRIPEEDVLCSKKLFFEADEQTRLYAVLEESYVLALERSQIPLKDKVKPRTSFNIALGKVCTSITSGWFREWAWEHYFEVLKLYNDNYVERFWHAVDSGVVKQISK